jgi:hypothetical protein
MKISQIAAATLVPATLAGVVLTAAAPFAQAAPVATAAHATHHAAPAKVVKATKPAEPAPSHAAKQARPAHQATGSTAGAAQASAPAPAPAPAPAAAPAQPLTAGMSAFETCVAWHESGDNPTASSAGLFGILPATWAQLGYSGTAGQASVALQKVAFQRLYAEYGTSPWAPYDGC